MKQFIFALSFLALAGSAWASTYTCDFSDTGEPAASWTLMYRSPASCAFTNYASAGRLSTGYIISGTPTYAYWECTAAGVSQGDYDFSFKYLALTSNYNISFGVRTGSYNGYWFKHAYGSGNFAPDAFGGTWGTTTTDDACALSANDIITIKVRGSDSTTTIEIYQGVTLRYAASNPSTACNSGPPGLGGYGGGTYEENLWTMDDLDVSDAVAASPTYTETVVQSPTSTPTITETATISPTPTVTPTITLTSTITVTSTPVNRAPNWSAGLPYIVTQTAKTESINAGIDINGMASFLALLRGDPTPTAAQVYNRGTYANSTISTRRVHFARLP